MVPLVAKPPIVDAEFEVVSGPDQPLVITHPDDERIHWENLPGLIFGAGCLVCAFGLALGYRVYVHPVLGGFLTHLFTGS